MLDVTKTDLPTGLPERFRPYASRSLPRYTSYPTALAFQAVDDDADSRAWLARIGEGDALSVYVHTPFCDRLCWYCGCHTSVPNGYERVARFVETLKAEIDLWADAVGPHGGMAHLHFGGGSPNALSPDDFGDLVLLLVERFGLRPGAEVAVELDPANLTSAFAARMGSVGVTRASLGVQTFDPAVQAAINRVQPYEQVAQAVRMLRDSGVGAINFDMMYGLPGQTPASTAESMEQALSLAPDRVALFGYAHVPWMKKHQAMIRTDDLADAEGRWAQMDAAQAVLDAHGYVRIGMDHYARPDDALAIKARAGGLKRNFQGYTDDPAPVLIGLGPSAIGKTAEGYMQNTPRTDVWAAAVAAGRLPTARSLVLTADDRLRAEAIERLMCDLELDVAALLARHGAKAGALDQAIQAARALQADGLCRVEGSVVTVPEDAARLVRVVAACFDSRLPVGETRHAMAA